jgi:hypothetical protein
MLAVSLVSGNDSSRLHAQPPDLPPALLMDMGFAITCPLAQHRRPCLSSGSCSSARVFAPPFFQTSPRDDILALRYHFTSTRL